METFDQPVKNYDLQQFRPISPSTKTHKDCARSFSFFVLQDDYIFEQLVLGIFY